LRLWQCDKENHGWREGLPLTDPCKAAIREGPSPSRYIQRERKKNTAVCRYPQTPSFWRLAGIWPPNVHWPCDDSLVLIGTVPS
jgi:hypothetical protein